jgi:tRNA nucleotidyltransferase (CCA-adding enzyme)
MEIYLVGGAVRDELLGLPVKERDWVVVGSTPEEMLRLGFRQVGRDFPVFLHPKTNEEYALARTERKVGAGHTGFVCHAGPDVTLEQDLMRRDLTVNAIAKAIDDSLIDPWGGKRDLEARVLRHVSAAFVEDPLRVFRVARLAARFATLGFSVAAETLELMRAMAAKGALRELSAERVGAEVAKALGTASPKVFFDVLRAVGALDDWLPEVTDASAAMIARIAPRISDPELRFAALGWDLESAVAARLGNRLKLPGEWLDLVSTVARDGRELARYRALEPAALFARLKSAGGLRRVRHFERALAVIGALADVDLTVLGVLATQLRELDTAGLREAGLEGRELGEALDRERVEIVAAFLE